MTATTDDLEDMCSYVLGTDYTQGSFDRLRVKAEAVVTIDLPGAGIPTQNEAVALLIGHRIFMRKHGASGMSSESIGDYSYTRSLDLVTGVSPWLAEYEKLASRHRPRPNAACVRHDAAPPLAFAMSNQRVSRYPRTNE